MQAEIFMLPIDRLTPSQLYISEKKLDGIRTWFDGNRLSDSIGKTEPIPLKRMAGRLLMLDGHTRAVAAYLAGARELPCIWEPDEWDWAAYAADIDLCASEGILSVEALSRRIVPEEAYKVLWDDRCDALYGELPYKVLTEGKEKIFFTRDPVPFSGSCEIRPWDSGFDDGEYFALFENGSLAAFGSVETYSFEFREAASVRVLPEFRGKGYGRAITAFLTNRITGEGKTATCRTLPENGPMNRIIRDCGYKRLYVKGPEGSEE